MYDIKNNSVRSLCQVECVNIAGKWRWQGDKAPEFIFLNLTFLYTYMQSDMYKLKVFQFTIVKCTCQDSQNRCARHSSPTNRISILLNRLPKTRTRRKVTKKKVVNNIMVDELKQWVVKFYVIIYSRILVFSRVKT